jgi:hypothetical protein
MKTDLVMRWFYTFFLLLATLGWGYLLLWTVEKAVVSKATIDIIGTAGVGTMLGVLLTLNVNVNQFWFRKKPPMAALSTPTGTK